MSPASLTAFCRRTAVRLAALTGVRRYGCAFAFGAVAALTQPPADFVPLLLVVFPPLLWLLDGAGRGRGAFLTGWWFGFGYLLIGLYWITFALGTDMARYWWMVPFAAAGLPAYLALWSGLATLALNRLPLRGLARALAFGGLWSLSEWLRGHALTGFPWLLTGYAWDGALPVLQSTAVIGIYGLSLLTVTVAALPAAWGADREDPQRVARAFAAGIGLFVVMGVAGGLRLAGAGDATQPGVLLRLVQPAIGQNLKWQPEEREANFQRHLMMSAAGISNPTLPHPTHVIWPETAVTFFLDQDGPRRIAMAAVAPEDGLLLTGAPRTALDENRVRRYWNAMLALDHNARIIGNYDKAHLVPFGEYVPGREALPSWLPLSSIAGRGVDFSAGPGPATVRLPGLPPVSPLICYEVIFPAAVTDPADRPQWLLNLTNDAWYGRTAGPHQHFAIARVRAVEEGLPLVRVANTGISGVVDAWGRITAALALGQRGNLDTLLPVALDAPTPYARFGDAGWGLLLLVIGILAATARQRRAEAPN